MRVRSPFQYVCVWSCLSSDDGRIRRRNSLSSLPMNDSESERPRSPFPIPSPVPLGHGRSQSSSSLHERDRGLPNGELAMTCKILITLIDIFTVLYPVENLEFNDVGFLTLSGEAGLKGGKRCDLNGGKTNLSLRRENMSHALKGGKTNL